MEDFVFDDDHIPDDTFHRAELEARGMTMESFIEYVMDRSADGAG